MGTTLLSLDQKLCEITGDWLQHPVTTAIAASTSVVSTHLQNYRSNADYFNQWWIYLEDYANLGTERLISDDDGTSTLTVLGSALTTDSANKATFRLTKYSRFTERTRAFNDAINELYPAMHANLDNRELITGNILPPFRWASSTSIHLPWKVTNATVTRTKTAGLVRSDIYSALVTASAGNGYLSCHSDYYRRLLDLQGKQVDVEVWAYPSTANDAKITVYTLSNDGTTSTTDSSTTSCAASQWTKLVLNNVSIGSDLSDIDIRFQITTNGETCYFSRPRIQGHDVYEYMLPQDFDNGGISEVYIQSHNYADTPADDLQGVYDNRVYGWQLLSDASYTYIRLPHLYASPYQIRILGDKPMAELSSSTDTIPIESHNLRPLLYYAAYRLFDMKSTRVNSEDRDRYKEMAMYHYGQYSRLSFHAPVEPSPQLNIRI